MKVQGWDRISTLPQPIIETVLCLLPIKDAARTSILSRQWRYKWTTIPKLVFSESMVSSTTIEEKQLKQHIESGRKHMDTTSKLFFAIYQVLLLRQAPIQEFSLKMCSIQSCFEIDQIIFHLSRSHTIKKLELDLNLIKCSPNLEKIKLEMFTDDDNLNEESVIFKEWPDVWLEHLNELDIDYFENHMTELEFVKFILARSLNLKKVILKIYMDNKNEELEMLKIILCAPRASPVKIIVENRYTA